MRVNQGRGDRDKGIFGPDRVFLVPNAAAPRTSGSARDRLLDAALARWATDGALTGTLDEIRDEAGVSVGALYHHFRDRQALADALFATSLAAYQEAFAAMLDDHPGAEDGVRAGVAQHLAWCGAHPARAAVLLGSRPAGDVVADQNRAFFARVLAWWRPHAHYGAVRDLPFDVVHAIWLGPSQEYLRHHLGGRAAPLPDDAAQVLADAAWLSLRAPTPTTDDQGAP
jgi:AcrR family transcriptional regulator